VSHRPRARHHERSTTDGRHDSSRGIRSIRRLDRCAHSSPPVLIASYSPTTCVARESDTTGLCDPRATAQHNVQRPHDQERTERVRPDPADPLVAPTSLTDASWEDRSLRDQQPTEGAPHLHPGAVKSLWGLGQGGFPRTDIKRFHRPVPQCCRDRSTDGCTGARPPRPGLPLWSGVWGRAGVVTTRPHHVGHAPWVRVVTTPTCWGRVGQSGARSSRSAATDQTTETEGGCSPSE
jgi:hypothetical protein